MIIEKIIDWQCTYEIQNKSVPMSYLVADDDVIALAGELCDYHINHGVFYGGGTLELSKENSFDRQLSRAIEKNNITWIKSLLRDGYVSGTRLRFHVTPTPEGGLKLLDIGDT